MHRNSSNIHIRSSPTDPVESHTVQATPLNLIDTVNDDGRHSGDGVGAEGSKVKVLNLLPLGGRHVLHFK